MKNFFFILSNITLLYVIYLLVEIKGEQLSPVQTKFSTIMLILTIVMGAYMNVPQKEIEEEKKSLYKKLGL